MNRKGMFVFIIAMLVLVSLSCTNPVGLYFSTQTAIMETATAAMWTPTATPTKTPTNTPVPSPTPNYLYFDDFENTDSGWDVSETAQALREYSDGGYRIKLKEEGYIAWWTVPEEENFSDVRIEVDALKIGGEDANEFGIICRYQDGDNFYGLEVSSAGYAWIYRKEGNTRIGLSSDQFEKVSGVNSDEANRVVAICRGEDFELYVNDELVAFASDSSFDSGEVGLIAGSQGDILFDNLYIYPAD